MKGIYRAISIENLAKESNVISEKQGLIVSRNAAKIERYLIYSKYPHIVEGFFITYCLKGTAHVKVNLQEYQVLENTVTVATPNNIIQILEHSDDLQMEFLFFTFDLVSDIGLRTEIRDIGKMMEGRSCLYLSPEEFQELLGTLSIIVAQHQKKMIYQKEIIKSLLYILCYQILQLYAVKTPEKVDRKLTRGEEIQKRFMSLLFKNYKTERSITFYAGMLNITPKYLSKVMRETGFATPSDIIGEMVIIAGKSLLKSSDLTVAQISEELNFANPSFFGAYFKKRTGMTPAEYREK